MYLVDVVIQNNGGTFHKCCETLEEVRAYAKQAGKPGDLVRILRNGDKLANAREIVIS